MMVLSMDEHRQHIFWLGITQGTDMLDSRREEHGIRINLPRHGWPTRRVMFGGILTAMPSHEEKLIQIITAQFLERILTTRVETGLLCHTPIEHPYHS
jgi:hypothetical protein